MKKRTKTCEIYVCRIVMQSCSIIKDPIPTNYNNYYYHPLENRNMRDV